MGAFEPTRFHNEYRQALRADIALAYPPPALIIPNGSQAIANGRTILSERLFRSAEPQADTQSLAKFVLSSHDKGLLSQTEIAHWLESSPTIGLYHLSHLSAARIGERTRLDKAFDLAALAKRFQGISIEPMHVADLATAGDTLGLYSAAELNAALIGMDMPNAQFAPYWTERLISIHVSPSQRYVFDDHLIDTEVHCHDEGVFFSLRTCMALINTITVPGDDSAESVLVRDTVLALVEGLTYATVGLTPIDCLLSTLPAIDDADALVEVMGGPFSPEGLLVKLEETLDKDWSEQYDSIEDAIQDEYSELYSLFLIESLESWASAMSILSEPNHWLRRSACTLVPMGTDLQENIRSLHRYCAGMVQSLRQHHGEKYPRTLCAANEILLALKKCAHQEHIHRSQWDYEGMQEADPLAMCLQNWLCVTGEEHQAINSIFEHALPIIEDDRCSSGGEFSEVFFISRDKTVDSSKALARFVSSFTLSAALLSELGVATHEEVPTNK